MTDQQQEHDNITCNGKALADWLGLSEMRISQLSVENVIPREAKGVYPVKECVRLYCEFLRRSSRGSVAAQSEKAERTRLTAARANIAELEHLQKTGELVEADVIRRQDAALATILANNLQSIADRISPIVAAETDEIKVHEIIATEAKTILRDIAAAMESTEVDDATLDITRREAAEKLESSRAGGDPETAEGEG